MDYQYNKQKKREREGDEWEREGDGRGVWERGMREGKERMKNMFIFKKVKSKGAIK